MTLLHDDVSGNTALFDAGEAEPVLQELKRKGWKLTHILLTHHHWDHVNGVGGLVQETGCQVLGYEHDASRLPALTHLLEAGEQELWPGLRLQVMHLPGHTLGHVVYYLPDQQRLFCGDVMFLMGCGRVFEGDYAQMLTALDSIAQLSDETLICCGHEYTQTNAEFALSIEPENNRLKQRYDQVKELQARGEATVPALLTVEKETNPFLRTHDNALKKALGLPASASRLDVFTMLRDRRNQW